MQYLLLIYSDRTAFADTTDDEQRAHIQLWSDYSKWLTEKGWMKGGDALKDVDQATSVRVQDGERLVTDGPFAETKETLGVENLDDAIEAAGRCPGAQYGTIELRPVQEMP